MSETKDKQQDDTTKKTKTLSLGGTLSLKGGAKPTAGGSTRGSGVAVEVRRKRTAPTQAPTQDQQSGESDDLRQLTAEEREARIEALKKAEEYAKQKKEQRAQDAKEREEYEAKKTEQEEKEDAAEKARQAELEELKRIEDEEKQKAEANRKQAEAQAATKQPNPNKFTKDVARADAEEEESYRARMKRQAERRPSRNTGPDKRRGGKLTVTQVLNEDYEKERGPSLAAQRRAREKARMAAQSGDQEHKKVSRDVVVPETITVQELAKRMGEQSGDVIKSLMKMGVMATINENIDADTAELVIDEFGHKIKRVTDADVEMDLEGPEDAPEDMEARPPVVTIMGHVDHGKTSLLDVLRATNVVDGEAGGITQHIGAYQITRPNGQKITFLDTPGHAAFTEMRARGANVTDIVVLVVAANDSIMPQTIEAISHAKAAGVPIIVAINKVDLPDADPQKVKTDLLQHEVLVEGMGGDTQVVEVSAKKKINLDGLEEAILLQAELLELKANPKRSGVGTVVEAKMEQGRGSVATVLIQRGTLKIGDIFVVGAQWGRVRALINDQGKQIKEAIPGLPVEILGLNGTPESGDHLVVVGDEAKARDVAEYRARKQREKLNVKSADTTFEEMLAHREQESKQHLELVIKGDVHGSVEAIIGSLNKIKDENEDVNIRILHSGVGGITESDVSLAHATGGTIIGFNVRANAQARQLAEKEGVDIRYYNIIYDVIDDAKKILSGLLAPSVREEYLGQAEIRQVFKITKVGKVAGCMVTLGMVKRGAKVRLLRDDVVIHDNGTLKTLKRHQDEVKEVKEGMECGMAFENYEDIKEGDIIECFEVVEEERSVE